ncbi:MAG: hypothetical protein AAFX85_04525 [Pseudomonadota bacterium]
MTVTTTALSLLMLMTAPLHAEPVIVEVPMEDCIDLSTGQPADDVEWLGGEPDDANGTNIIDCSFVYRVDPSTCNADTPCDNLVVSFSGGGMKCEAKDIDPNFQPPGEQVDGYAQHLDRYFSAGNYLVVQACVVEPGDRERSIRPSNHLSFHLEANRVKALLERIRAEPRIDQGWNGQHLLLSGVSHGPAAVILGLARSPMEHEARELFRGVVKTGICAYDTPLDAIARERDYVLIEAPHFCNGDGNGTRVNNICKRFRVNVPQGEPFGCNERLPEGAGDERCATLTGPVPDGCSLMTFDSLVSPGHAPWTGADFGHDMFKIVSCASDPVDVCFDDHIPDDADEDGVSGLPHDGPTEPHMREVCAALNAEGKRCTFEANTFPSDVNNPAHRICITHPTTIESCKQWFERYLYFDAFDHYAPSPLEGLNVNDLPPVIVETGLEVDPEEDGNWRPFDDPLYAGAYSETAEDFDVRVVDQGEGIFGGRQALRLSAISRAVVKTRGYVDFEVPLSATGADTVVVEFHLFLRRAAQGQAALQIEASGDGGLTFEFLGRMSARPSADVEGPQLIPLPASVVAGPGPLRVRFYGEAFDAEGDGDDLRAVIDDLFIGSVE